MADRDAELDILARDKTGPAITSVERNLKRVARESERSSSAVGRIADQWGRGFARIGGAASRWAASGDTAGKRFVRGVGSGLGKLSDLGGGIGNGLSKAVSAAGPYVQVALVGVLASAALAAAPVIAGALVGGAGLGGVVGGLLIASRDVRVRSAFEDLTETVGGQLQDAAGRFVPAALDAINEVKGAFAGMMPDLRRLFDVSATWLAPLTAQVGRGAQAALAGITAAVVKAGPIIRVVGEGIEGILRGVGDGFRMLSDNGVSMALAVKGALALVEIGVRGAFFVLNILVEVFERVAALVPGLRAKMVELMASQDGAKGSAYRLGEGFQAMAEDANLAADGITRVQQKADELVNSNISLARAQIASREATAQATQAIKDNANAKLTNAQRADANMSALLRMAEAYNTETAAGQKSKIGAGQAAAAYSTNRAALIRMAEQAGHSRQKAQQLADRLLTMPKNVSINVGANTGGAVARVDSFIKKVRQLDGTVANVIVRVTQQGNHYIPGVGTQMRDAAGDSWYQADGGMTSRTGGPTRVEATVNQTLNVTLDGQPFYAYTSRAIAQEQRRERWRQTVGAR